MNDKIVQLSATTKIYGVIGENVQYSLSPTIHNAAFGARKIDAVYLAFCVPKIRQQSILSALETLNISGANITVPYKTVVFQQLSNIDPTAQKLGSINTLVRNEQGWKGYSTDGEGFVRALADASVVPSNHHFHVLGAGGAAKAITFALLDAGAKSLSITNRSQAPLASLTTALKQHFPQAAIDNDSVQSGDVLINTTPLGKDGTTLSAPLDWIKKASTVIDILYAPAKSPLLALAEQHGKKIQNGLPMLVHQAIAAFEIWYPPAPKEVMANAVGLKIST